MKMEEGPCLAELRPGVFTKATCLTLPLQPHASSCLLCKSMLDVIDRCFSGRTVEEIIAALEREATHGGDDWISITIRALKKASPASVKISLRSIREGRLQGVGQCLSREYRMVCHVLKGDISKDFVEGCRAILIDKDKNPKWEPWRLEEMKDRMVEQYFKRVEEEEDLKLLPRKNLPALAMANGEAVKWRR